MYQLSDRTYKYISSTIYDYAGIHLPEQKKNLIVARLSKRLTRLGFSSFDDYVEFLRHDDVDKKEFENMVNSLSTNYSHFFRENHHFEFLESEIFPKFLNKHMNIWSAASSTGQEVYSILFTLKNFERKVGKKIYSHFFASDISSNVLKTAASGLYNFHDSSSLDKKILQEYFLRGEGKMNNFIKVKKQYTSQIKFQKINLKDSSYNLPKMDVIFLRNAIIYFDHPTKAAIIDHMHRQLNPGGYLFIGHSESLSSISKKFRVVGKTIYRREE
ncbi:MAG: protein-glutamate O-methyltransferase CheR [Spirochaetales bacterium]|nr:protein-glutamate O-methyltransferase CheR [Spirochaetales bacterium]